MGAETFSLAGKFALVTGSSKEHGIGAAIVRSLARNGAAVAIHYVSESSKAKAEGVAANITKEFGTKTTVVRGAVEEAGTAKTIVEAALKGLDTDHIDILVNNAGGGDNKALMDITPEQIQHEFGLNVFGTIYLTQAVVGTGKMPRGGRIVNIGTIASKLGLEGVTVYSAAKAAQDSITASLAGELGKSRGITVNTVAPGPVPTDASKPFLEKPDGSPSEMQVGMIATTRAAARLGATEDIADAVLLLVSEKSRWITAQWISVSGGITGTM
ncbi:hypothetical protein C8A01DRAFT_20968 [Parachaetomium inaequale]|uniref:Short-chain dehydrogenase n=1 Tax=Parachaetomium inaequale TaxID=2588326 RepID=A0AAN6P7M5_9PEZI|nr:hypothetical protein C8A01DRAFT_20968 [Parachaetomium inaequale]